MRQIRVGWVGKGFLGYCDSTDKGVGVHKPGVLQKPLPVSVAGRSSIRLGMAGMELEQWGGGLVLEEVLQRMLNPFLLKEWGHTEGFNQKSNLNKTAF